MADTPGHRSLTSEEVQTIQHIKSKAEQFRAYVDQVIGGTRSGATAKTKIDEAEMWAVRGVAQGQ